MAPSEEHGESHNSEVRSCLAGLGLEVHPGSRFGSSYSVWQVREKCFASLTPGGSRCSTLSVMPPPKLLFPLVCFSAVGLSLGFSGEEVSSSGLSFSPFSTGCNMCLQIYMWIVSSV